MMTLLHPGRWSLSFKLPLAITAVVAGVAFTIGATTVWLERQHLRTALEEQALLLARAVASGTAEAVASHDYWSVYKALRFMTTVEGRRDALVVSGVVLDAGGRVMAHLDPKRHPLGLPLEATGPEAARLEKALAVRAPALLPGDGIIEGLAPIRLSDSTLGVVRLQLSTNELDARTRGAALTVLALTALLAVVGSVLGAVLSRRMVRPLNDLAHSIETFGQGGHAPVAVRDRDEIGLVIDSWNRMAGEVVEKRALEQQLAVSEKLAALGRITAGVAHEVNNPLTGMLNCVDTLERHRDDPSILERYLPLLRKGLVRIHAIVQSLLVELRAEGASELGGGSTLDDLRDLVAAEIGDRPIALVWDNRLDETACLNCSRVQQVVLNLLRNAVQAMPDGGVVRFRALVEGGSIVLDVEDNGEGIAPEHMSHLFDPFYTSRANGTGLGLWITYRLVETMRGRITVESEPGVGTLFRVQLPANPEEA